MSGGSEPGAPAIPPVRPEIALSWKRSVLSGVRPDASPDPGPPSGDEAAERLLEAARPVLDELRTQLTGTGFCVLLADHECRVVSRVVDNRALERRLDSLAVVVGSPFGEDVAGTNALGTPLEIRRAIVINGAEHYLERFKGLSCYGHPIVHPATRRVAGILDMTGAAAQANPLFAPFLTRAVADIEQRLLDGSRVSQQRLVDAFQRLALRRHLAVTAIGEDILLSNRAATDLLDGADHATLRTMAADLRPDQSRTLRVRLASGELARVRADRVPGTDGALFILHREHAADPIPRSGTRRPAPGERARSRLRRLRHSSDHVLICGEPGTGRTSAVHDLAGTASHRILDAATIPLTGPTPWLAALNEALTGVVEIVAVENVQLVPESVIPVLARHLSETLRPRLLLTSTPLDDVPAPVAALLARCPARVPLPPLRKRRGELSSIAGDMLEEIDGRPSLAPSALEALAAADWSGNLSELHAVLRSAARHSSHNRIGLADLPDAYRISSRVARLSGRDRAEREAIVEALRECEGNKVHAAQQLGISRSTLYSRIRALDISV